MYILWLWIPSPFSMWINLPSYRLSPHKESYHNSAFTSQCIFCSPCKVRANNLVALAVTLLLQLLHYLVTTIYYQYVIAAGHIIQVAQRNRQRHFVVILHRRCSYDALSFIRIYAPSRIISNVLWHWNEIQIQLLMF